MIVGTLEGYSYSFVVVSHSEESAIACMKSAWEKHADGNQFCEPWENWEDELSMCEIPAVLAKPYGCSFYPSQSFVLRNGRIFYATNLGSDEIEPDLNISAKAWSELRSVDPENQA